MTVSEPSYTSAELIQWADNNRYTEGKHRTVTFFSYRQMMAEIAA